MSRPSPIAGPTHVVGRIADAKHAVKQQVDGAAARADDQINAGYRVGKAGAGLSAQALDAQQQRHAQGDGTDDQCTGETPIPKTFTGEGQNRHGSSGGPCRVHGG